MVGSQTTSSAYFQAGVYVAGSGSVVVSSASTLALWGNCTINGDLSLASTASLWVCSLLICPQSSFLFPLALEPNFYF